MNFKKVVLWMLLSLFVLSQVNSSNAKILERKEVPDKYKWNLADLYPSVDVWEAKRAELESKLSEFDNFKGHLTDSPEALYKALRFYFDYSKELSRLYSYASKMVDQDLRVSKNQELIQKVSVLWTKFGEKTSFINPELVAVDSAKLMGFIEKKKELEEFSSFLYDVIRQKPHTLSPNEEKILASASLITSSADELYSIFDNTEMPRPKVKLSTGEEITLTAPNYVKYRSTNVREDRAKIFKALFENYGKYKNTMAVNLVANAKNHYFYAKNRNYKSCLERALSANNIPTSVYTNLIDQIHKNLNVLHEYLILRKKLLGVDTLHYYDLYVPLVKKVDLKYSIEDARKIFPKALKVLGKEYTNTVERAFTERWIDFMPTAGKRSGAYSSGSAYDVHPYILINWNGDYESLSTLFHEMGHTMHSYLSNKYQPYAKSQYPIFVAEIASTFNENLLNHYLVKKVKSKEEKMFLLGSYLENLRQTIFRQTLFAEFELIFHEKVEKGEPLTGETLSKIYYDLLKLYYGHDKGICIIDPEDAYEWEYIPHFYYNFYVYQYATSLIYSTAFAEKVIHNKKEVKNYMKILKGGCSKYPLDLIRDAGIDPLGPEAFNITMKRMQEVIKEISKLAGLK